MKTQRLKTQHHDTEAIAAHLRACEQALLDPAVRSDRAQVNEFLAEDFQEFGSSGRVWNRAEILDELANEPPVALTFEDFQFSLIVDSVALVTYRTIRVSDQPPAHITSLRSSLWTKKDTTWKLRFHQGTRIP